jgi:hypothetical protein
MKRKVFRLHLLAPALKTHQDQHAATPKHLPVATRNVRSASKKLERPARCSVLLDLHRNDCSLQRVSFIMQVTVTRRKPSVNATVGLLVSWHSKLQLLIITGVSADGIFADSELQEGMVVESINGFDTEHFSATEMMDSVERATGNITVTAHKMAQVTVRRIKAHTGSSIGLRLALRNDTQQLTISHVEPGSLFADSELREGMGVVSINGLDMQGFTTQQAAGLVKRVKGEIIITAQVPPPEASLLLDDLSVQTGHLSTGSSASSLSGARGPRITVQVLKSSLDEALGLGFEAKAGEGMVITHVHPMALLGATGLRPGMRLISVNSVHCSKLPNHLVRDILDRVHGELTIVAEEPPPTPQYIVGEAVPVEIRARSAVAVAEPIAHAVPVEIGARSSSVRTAGSSVNTGASTVVASGRRERNTGWQARDLPSSLDYKDLGRDMNSIFISDAQPIPSPPPVAVSVPSAARRSSAPSSRHAPGPSGNHSPTGAPSHRFSMPSRRRSPAAAVPVAVHRSSLPSDLRPPIATEPPPIHRSPVPSLTTRRSPAASPIHRSPVSPLTQVPSRRPPPAIPPPPLTPPSPARLLSPVTVSAYRATETTRIGIRVLCKKSNGSVVIEVVSQQGLFGGTPLRPGMILQSINGRPCQGRAHAEIISSLSQCVGELQLVASPAAS